MMRQDRWSCVLGLLILGFASCLFAQDLATLKTTVSDQTGAVIPGASITITNAQTGAKRTDVTESHGLSVIPGLPPGNYELAADAKGFTSRKIAVTLSVGQIASVVVTLGLSIKEEVHVQDVIQRRAATGL